MPPPTAWFIRVVHKIAGEMSEQMIMADDEIGEDEDEEFEFLNYNLNRLQRLSP